MKMTDKEIAASDLREVVRRVRNIASNASMTARAMGTLQDVSLDIEDVINLLEGNAQHP
jgi:hypothetical protein